MTKLRFYFYDNEDNLWDEGESSLVPKQGDNIILNNEKFVVTKTILDFDNDELKVIIQQQPNTPWQ